VTAGFGDYEAAANSDIVEAAVFLFLGKGVDKFVDEFLNG
jgi:hypothetical protein